MQKLRNAVIRWLRPVKFPDYQSSSPLSTEFGLDRGTPVDRYYIENFIRRHRDCLQGSVLEVGESTYSKRFGTSRISQFDVLHRYSGNPQATLVADLADHESLPENRFDCFICTQTLNFIFDVQLAVEGCYRLLKPGGILLATVAGICQISRADMNVWGDYWRFTNASVERLFRPVFGEGVQIENYGNVLAATALLQGLAVEDLPDTALLDQVEDDYQVVLSVVARKGVGERHEFQPL